MLELPSPFFTRCVTFVEDPAPNAQLSIGAYTLTKLKRCFSVLKAMVIDGRQALGGGSGGGETRPQRKLAIGDGASEPGTQSTGELGGQVQLPRRARTLATKF